MSNTRRHLRGIVLTTSLFSVSLGFAQTLINPGFEQGWEGWGDGDPTGNGTSISGEARTGSSSVKLTEESTFASQTVAVQPNSTYRLTAYVLGAGTLGVKVGSELFFDQPEKVARDWQQLEVVFLTGDQNSISIFGSNAGDEGRFDDFSLTAVDGEALTTSPRVLTGAYGLSPDLPPGRNFDLLDWYLNTPADEDNSGTSDRYDEVDLAKGATDERYFYTAEDGGMVFRTTIGGAKTSANTAFTRTELREMLRRGDTSIRTRLESGEPNKNNWVFSSTPETTQRKAGGVDGTLFATLAVNHVTTTGDANQVGTVVIGQIHAKTHEPARLYYRKLPNNSKGSVYVAHERADGEDIYYDILGSRSDNAADPEDGIALDQKFSYQILARGDQLIISIGFEGEVTAQEVIDMSESGYDASNDYMYFKAGVYTQNSTGDPHDYDKATFYELDNSHEGYEF